MASRAYRRAMLERDRAREARTLQQEAQKRQDWTQGLSMALALGATAATGGAASPLVAAALAGGAKLGGTALGNYIAGDMTGGKFHKEARGEAIDATKTFGAKTLSSAALDAVTAGAGQYLKTAKGLKEAKKLIAASESAEALKALSGEGGAAVALAGMSKIDPEELARARKIVEAGKFGGVGKYGLDFSDSFAKSTWDKGTKFAGGVREGIETRMKDRAHQRLLSDIEGIHDKYGEREYLSHLSEKTPPGFKDATAFQPTSQFEKLSPSPDLPIGGITNQDMDARYITDMTYGEDSFLNDPINIVDTPLQEFSDWNMPAKEAWQVEPMGGAGSGVQQTIQDQRNLLNTRLQRDLGRAYQQGMDSRMNQEMIGQNKFMEDLKIAQQQYPNVGIEEVFNTSPSSPRDWNMYDLYEGGMNERRR